MPASRFLLWYTLAMAASPRLFSQRPAVYPGGVVNAASFARAGQPGSGVAPGSIAAIFGLNLASTTAFAPGLPLPKALGGTSVTFDGVPAPLFYVSPNQLNVQVPAGQAPSTAKVVVTTARGTSDTVEVDVGPWRLGIFTLDSSGCGRGAVFNVGPEGSLTLNGPNHTAQPGDVVAIFGTGLGAFVVPLPPDGEPSPVSPLAEEPGGYVSVGRWGESAVSSEALYSGRAPTMVGLDQFNGVLPADSPEGCSVPLRISYFLFPSQPVPVSIRRGRGACVDPPADSTGVLTWKRTITSSLRGTTQSEELLIDFSAGIGKTLPQPLVPDAGCRARVLLYPPPPMCIWAADTPLDAGTLTAQAGSLPAFQVVPQSVGGKPAYRAVLPTGTIGSGVFTVSGAGGRDVRPFHTLAALPAPIELTTVFKPGTNVAGNGPLILTWKGGDPNSVVRLNVISTIGDEVPLFSECTVPASAGTLTYDFRGYTGLPYGSGEIVVTQTPASPLIQRFQSPGLTLGGVHSWIYEFRFRDLTI